MDSLADQIKKASHLRSLFTILIFAFIASGVALVLIYKIQIYGNEQDLMATQSALPVHNLINKQTGGLAQSVAGWKTYQNKKFGFEFQYPGDQLSVSEQSDVVIIGAQSPLILISMVNVGRESVFDPGSGVKLNDIMFAGKRAQEYDCPVTNKCPIQVAYSRAIHFTDLPTGWGSSNEISFDISKQEYYQSSAEEMNVLANKILGTFKFTSVDESTSASTSQQVVVDITNWKTYKNAQYGFEFQYPAGVVVGDQKQSVNLGTNQNPAYGINIGGGVLVPLSNADFKATAVGIFSQVRSYIDAPKKQVTGEMPPPQCQQQLIDNPLTKIEGVYCVGEGGPAYYVYISGKNTDFFYDGYAGKNIENDIANKIFATFKFTN